MKKSVAVTAASIACIALIAGIVISSFMLSRFMLKIQHSTEKKITVKGVAEKVITSDVAVFTCAVKAKGNDKVAGYRALESNKKRFLAYLDALGFTSDMREDEDISCYAQHRTVRKKDARGNETSESIFSHYELSYSLRVRTTNVQLVARNVLRLHGLAAQGVDLTVGTPQYFINNPEQYKLELVNAASASAAQRAKTAAQNSGSELGPLMEARQGVIQITAPASTDSSDSGVYDTGSVQKVIRLVMTMKFALK
jgi:hypothetical protein